MALINNEEGAKRLARVILSDIELYSRERPNDGETLESQIEDGRRLFGTRVAPALIPLFASVLADRQAGGDKTPAVMPVPPRSAAESMAPGGPIAAESPSAIELAAAAPTPAPQLVAAPVSAEPSTPAPARGTTRVAKEPLTPRPRPASRVSAVATPQANDETTPGPARSMMAPGRASGDEEVSRPARRRVAQAGQATPPPVPASERERREPRRGAARPHPQGATTPIAGVSAPLLTSPPAAVVSPPPVAALAPEIAVPVLTSRISIWKMAAVVAATASAIAVLYRFAP